MSHSAFAWGLAPADNRAQVMLAPLGGCTVTDAVWGTRVTAEDPGMGISGAQGLTDGDADAAACSEVCDPMSVPRLLMNEYVVRLAGRLLQFRDKAQTFLTPPTAHVETAHTSRDHPPSLWLVRILACFPCPGTPIARCVRATVLLDARDLDRSRTLGISDAGVVPAEEAVNGGLVPSNTTASDTMVR